MSELQDTPAGSSNWLSHVARSLARHSGGRNTPQLTPAEQHVMLLILDGCSNATIGRRRGTSSRTIANQVNSLMRKLNRSSRVELAAYAAGFALQDASADWLADQRNRAISRLGQLKPHQRRAVSMRARGVSVKVIAFELGLAHSTVSNEIRRAMKTLELRSSLELCAVLGEVDV